MVKFVLLVSKVGFNGMVSFYSRCLDLQADETRHVFFHHDAPVDFYPPAGYGLPDDEGYYRGVNTKKGRRKDNRVSLPFKIKLPIGGGAKGPLKSKSGFVRYIVIGWVTTQMKFSF